MGFKSKTYSLSDEVVAVFDEFKAQGVSPNQLLMRIMGIGKINPNGGLGDNRDIEEMRQRHLQARASAPILSPEDQLSLKQNARADLDTYGPELSAGQGKATTETFRRGPRQKGDTKR